MHLHTRTVRYGKLENGLLVYVRPSLVRRSKHHFITLPRTGVDIVLGTCSRLQGRQATGILLAHDVKCLSVRCALHAGNNGYVWLSRALTGEGAEEADDVEGNLMSAKAEVRGRHVLSSPVAITPHVKESCFLSCSCSRHRRSGTPRHRRPARRDSASPGHGTPSLCSIRCGAGAGVLEWRYAIR